MARTVENFSKTHSYYGISIMYSENVSDDSKL